MAAFCRLTASRPVQGASVWHIAIHQNKDEEENRERKRKKIEKFYTYTHSHTDKYFLYKMGLNSFSNPRLSSFSPDKKDFFLYSSSSPSSSCFYSFNSELVDCLMEEDCCLGQVEFVILLRCNGNRYLCVWVSKTVSFFFLILPLSHLKNYIFVLFVLVVSFSFFFFLFFFVFFCFLSLSLSLVMAVVYLDFWILVWYCKHDLLCAAGFPIVVPIGPHSRPFRWQTRQRHQTSETYSDLFERLK